MNILEKLSIVILPILLTAFFYSIIPRKLKERQRFNEAANRFKEAFVEEIRFLDRFYAIDRVGRDIPDILALAADKHEQALLIFKDGFLSKRQCTKIEQAWKIYTGEGNLMGKYTFKQYATYGKFKDAENIRKCALSKIEKLLKFADLKH